MPKEFTLKKDGISPFLFKNFYAISCKYSSSKRRRWTIAESRRVRDRRSRIFVGTIPMVYRRAHLFVAGHTFY